MTNQSTRGVALAVVAALALTIGSCHSSSSGGGPPPRPAAANQAALLLAVTCTVASPAAGDRLRFVLSEEVELVLGAILNDADLTISGGTLGAVVTPPTRLSAREVEITLGAGAAVTVGATTFMFGAGNDAVVDLDGLPAAAGPARTLTQSDADAPSVTGVTLNAIHPLLNGSGPAGGTLQVPENGFDIDLTYSDASNTVDPSRNVIVADAQVFVDSVSAVLPLAAGDNLVPFLTANTATAAAASYTVPAGVRFPIGLTMIHCFVVDTSGRLSLVASFELWVKRMTAILQPFETTVHAGQVWFLDTSRNLESMSVNLANPTTPVVVTLGSNSRSDLEDLFQILGMWLASPVTVGSDDSNTFIMNLFKARIITKLDGFYAGTKVSFTFTQPAGGPFPSTSPVIDYNAFPYSQMCIAGSSSNGGNTGVAGLALFDPHNEVQVDDCDPSFFGSRLGVFLHTMVNQGYLSGAASAFAVTFNPFTPTRVGGGSGIPMGTHGDGQDPNRLLGTNTDSRGLAIHAAINALADMTAFLVAHECGHSMGLVQDGGMPFGLYGNHPSFAGSSSGHIDMPTSVFPGNALNIMTPFVDFVGTIDAGSKFNSLNLAYLREQVIYNNN